MKKIINTAVLVKRILEEKPETRNDDYLLWAETILVAVRQSTDLYVHDLNMIYALRHIRELNLPDFGTVGRARRKLQEKFPELRGSERVRQERAKREIAFEGFAKL